MLRRVLYVSRIAEGVTDQVLRHIIATAQIHNRRLDLSGVLAVGPGLFAQVIEGAKDAIATTLERILVDKRHYDIHIVLDTETSTRFFDRWSMELLVDETAAELAVQVRDGERGADEFLTYLRRQHAQDPVVWSHTLNALAISA